ncbi:MAG: hypothetical protein EAZ24_13480 [Burkholderiales bacterium]|nr:MAG: hypothetical protein EAZ24_13480 [Burkholderiales bacterium]TAG79336.1 MAG: hypothetical protein EAZ21_10745 [Betaproteobacteria bacterium]
MASPLKQHGGVSEGIPLATLEAHFGALFDFRDAETAQKGGTWLHCLRPTVTIPPPAVKLRTKSGG